ncbi:DUF2391 domain-containing protein [Halarchaeum nitratireducens]|uniref:Membrane protein n=1 Tax=Halarchaeum nitratireducens TaxID=489913 RepID=A0A830GHI3_9EURY|nr:MULTISPECIES: DUF2391 domain-containing protein [Halarchaeum]MBP2252867.1 putative membrane protein [Halarchaeum solikamskense]GGN26658.1 membrane protein [Halarchaeum nitratireducens]
MVRRTKRYALADTAQQIVGGFLLAGPFVVTEEVWGLASNMRWYHVGLTLALVAAIGYGALYRADDDRDPEREAEVAGVPIRFVSLMGVSFGAVLILAVAFRAPQTFAANLGLDLDGIGLVCFTLKATSVGAVFSVVGAATADSVF